MHAPLRTHPAAMTRARTQNAWSAFWQQPGQSRCIAGAVDIAGLLDEHWRAMSASLPAGARVLDLGCGAGAVGRAMLAVRRDLCVTGVDFAKIPLTLLPQLELLADAVMEALPFADESFAAAASQFGFEYGDTERTAAELARVLAPGAPFSLIVHHAESSIVAADRARLAALDAFLGERMRLAFCAGDPAFMVWAEHLHSAFPYDSVVAELVQAMTTRLSRAPRERLAIWSAVEDAMAPEICLAEALLASCVTPDDFDRWTNPLRAGCTLTDVSILREPSGAPLAWCIEGARSQ